MGKKFWSRFLNRNANRIETKRGQKFAKDRDDWSIYNNFDIMYNKVYDNMVKANVAEKIDVSEWTDKESNMVSKEFASGQKVLIV